MKIAILSRYQNEIQRGAETFVNELSLRLGKINEVNVLAGNDSDSLERILKGKYDIVISINGGFQSLRASFGRILGKYKLIIVGEAGIGKAAIWNTAIAIPDVFVAVTDYMAGWIKKWAWNSKVIKINNGIDLDKFTSLGEKITIDLPRPIILSVGALVWYKYHEKVIDAVSQAGKGSVLIVGKGPLQEELKKRGEEKLGQRFKIMDAENEDMPKIYRSADLFTLPSWDREAFGIVYLEAMASGLGVVAPDDSSRREIVGDAGLFTDVADPKTYAKAIQKALGIDWSKKARLQAEKFSWEKISDQYEKLLLDLR